jgi:5-methylcytosine-specific restriction endonuclease McrA
MRTPRKEYMRNYQVTWLAARRKRAIELLGGKCAACGSTDDLEFDHIDPTTKDPLLRGKHRQGFPWSWAWKRIEIELTKCQLLCEKCHLTKTREQLSFIPPHGTTARYKRKDGYRCRCVECRKAAADYQREHRRLTKLIESTRV